MTFKEFMDYALYSREDGYYTSHSGQIGFSGGDFFTSSEADPLFGELIAIQAMQIDRILGEPPEFCFVELGAGKGLMALHMLEFLQKNAPGLFERISYIIVEKSDAMITAQSGLLSHFPSVRWDSMEGLHGISGIVFSNEFFDALPVHRIKVQDQALLEVYVDKKNGCFTERLGPVSTTRIEQYFRLTGLPFPEGYPDGYETEVNTGALDYMQAIGRTIKKGYVITIDYGYPADQYYAKERTCGTALSYYKHTVSDNFYENVGQRDITAHVDFTALARQGELSGLEVAGFSNQLGFLVSIAMSNRLHPEEKLAAIKNIAHPYGMGKTFKVLVQKKGLQAEETLAGLTLKPFFETV